MLSSTLVLHCLSGLAHYARADFDEYSVRATAGAVDRRFRMIDEL
jgi:hypothetical protein